MYKKATIQAVLQYYNCQAHVNLIKLRHLQLQGAACLTFNPQLDHHHHQCDGSGSKKHGHHPVRHLSDGLQGNTADNAGDGACRRNSNLSKQE